jgi:TPR repeat protein
VSTGKKVVAIALLVILSLMKLFIKSLSKKNTMNSLMLDFVHAENSRTGNSKEKTVNLNISREFYEKSAILTPENVPERFKKNLHQSQFLFAKMCYYPLGGPKDLEKAKFYLEEASKGGHEKATLFLNRHFFKDL